MSDGGVLAGKIAIVLGASRGIGETIARAMFAAGASVVLGARDLPKLEVLGRELDPAGSRTLPIHLDMTDPASIEAAIAASVDRFGRLDVAVNNAGVQLPRTPFDEISDADFDALIAVNLRGVFIAMKHEIRAMKASGTGSIVNIASAGGLVGIPLIAPYIASKHGVIGLTKSAAIELAPQGIRVNSVVPGTVMTEMLRIGPASSPEALARMLGMVPMGRLGTTDEIAAAAIWLASDASSYVTGIALPVDGGMTVP